MGVIFIEHVRDSEPKYTCNTCRADVASCSSLIWEGFMSLQKPAILFSDVVNIHCCSKHREERFSSGTYVLADVECRRCRTALGWRYITASNEDQKYKEGATLLQETLISCTYGHVRLTNVARTLHDEADLSTGEGEGDDDCPVLMDVVDDEEEDEDEESCEELEAPA